MFSSWFLVAIFNLQGSDFCDLIGPFVGRNVVNVEKRR